MRKVTGIKIPEYVLEEVREGAYLSSKMVYILDYDAIDSETSMAKVTGTYTKQVLVDVPDLEAISNLLRERYNIYTKIVDPEYTEERVWSENAVITSYEAYDWVELHLSDNTIRYLPPELLADNWEDYISTLEEIYPQLLEKYHKDQEAKKKKAELSKLSKKEREFRLYQELKNKYENTTSK